MLGRPKEIAGESWPGYLMRLAQSNDFNGIEELAKVLGMTFMALLTSSPKEGLERLGIISVFATDSCDACAAPYRAYMGVAGRTVRSRICARCLGSMPIQHIRASWDRALEMNCRFHHIQLCDECPACHAPITYRRRKVGSCDCGFNFSNAPTNDEAGFNVSRLYHIFGLQDIYSRESPTYGNSSPAEVIAVTVIQRLQLLETGLTGIRRPCASKGDAFMSARSLTFLEAWLEHWPEGFIQSMMRTRRDIRTTRTRTVLGSSPNSYAAFPVLRSTLQELDLRKRKSPWPGNGSTRVIQTETPPYVGIKYLMKATGSAYDAVKYWISQGRLGQVETFDIAKRRVGYRIDRAKAQKVIQVIESTSSARELSLSVGIDKSALRALAQDGVIRTIPYGKRGWNVRFLPIDVFQLATALLNIAALGRASSSPRLLLEQAIGILRKKGTPGLIGHFIDAVLGKRIRISFMGMKPCRLDELTLLYTDLIHWRTGFVKTQSEAQLLTDGGPTAILAISAKGSQDLWT